MKLKRRESGFTLVESVIAVAIIGIVMSVAVIGMSSILPTYRANEAMNQVFSQLRGARERAISQRRNVQVQFIGTNQMQLTEIGRLGTANTVFPVVSWEGGAVFSRFAALPDTPMGFGTCGAAGPVCFENINGGPPTMTFTPSGTFIDGGNTVVDGTVFLGIAGSPMSARAVTVLGSTGRVRQYHWNGTTWEE